MVEIREEELHSLYCTMTNVLRMSSVGLDSPLSPDFATVLENLLKNFLFFERSGQLDLQKLVIGLPTDF